MLNDSDIIETVIYIYIYAYVSIKKDIINQYNITAWWCLKKTMNRHV